MNKQRTKVTKGKKVKKEAKDLSIILEEDEEYKEFKVFDSPRTCIDEYTSSDPSMIRETE